MGDTVCLYVAQPFSAILYRCRAMKIDIPYNYTDGELKVRKVMEIELVERYDPQKYTFARLNEFGIRAVRGPRRMPERLKQEMGI